MGLHNIDITAAMRRLAERRIEELRVQTGRGVHERDPDEPVETAE